MVNSLWPKKGPRASPVAQTIKNLPALQEILYYSILAWRVPWTEEPGGLQSMGSEKVWHDWMTNTHTQAVPNGPFFAFWSPVPPHQTWHMATAPSPSCPLELKSTPPLSAWLWAEHQSVCWWGWGICQDACAEVTMRSLWWGPQM